jgi:hypothetical protein
MAIVGLRSERMGTARGWGSSWSVRRKRVCEAFRHRFWFPCLAAPTTQYKVSFRSAAPQHHTAPASKPLCIYCTDSELSLSW